MKIFEYKAGSFIEQVSKTVMTPTAVSHRQTEKGIAGIFNGTSSQIDTGISSNSYLTGGFSTHFAIKPYSNGQGGFGRIWAKRGSSPVTGISVNMNGGTIGINNTLQLNSSIIPFNQWSFFSIIVESNGDTKIYLNGNLNVAGNIGALSSITTTVNLIISNQPAFTRAFDGEIKSIKIDSSVCSLKEIQKEYEEFLRAGISEKPIRGFEYPKPTDLSNEKDSYIGTDLAKGWNFTNWSAFFGAVIINNNTFTSDSDGTNIFKSFSLVPGKKYVVNYTGSSTAGTLIATQSASGGTGLTITSGVPFTAVASVTGIVFRNESAATNTVTSFSIQEVSGLVAAYNMIPNGNTLVDISGNGNNGTITEVLTSKDGLKFNNSGSSKSYVTLDTADNVAQETVQFAIDLKSIAVSGTFYQHFVFNTRGYRLSICNCGILRITTCQGGGSTTTALQAISLGKHTIQIAVDNTNSKVYSTLDGVTTGYAITPYVIGSAETRYLGDYGGGASSADIVMIDHRRYNRLLTSTEAQAYHNSFIKPVILEDFSRNPVGDIL